MKRMSVKSKHKCVSCGRRLPLAKDMTGPRPHELTVDTQGWVSANEYVCGCCMDAAEYERMSRDSGSLDVLADVITDIYRRGDSSR